LILEQLARNRVFLTDTGLAKLRQAFIIIVGCGGVGSHAVAALCRSGVSKIRLIDFDQVTLSSLNRHAVATLADVGTPKVHTIRKRLEQITPWVHFDCRNELFSASSAESQLSPLDGQAPDYVVDAIDNIESKVDLLKYCHEHKIPVISSMGAGCKSDPTRVSIGDISTSTDDPLSRSTRRRLRLAGIKDGIPVVFSSEKPGPGKAELLPLSEEEFAKGNVGELGVLKDFRVRILPVLGTMPAVFGLCVANHIMLEVGGYPHDYLITRSRDKMYDSILTNLQGQEEKLARAMGKDAFGLRLPLTTDDVAYLVEEIFRGKSAISGLPTRLVLTRWRQPYKSFLEEKYPGQRNSLMKMTDLVLMTKEEAAVHDKEILRGDKTPEDLYSPTVLKLVEERIAEEKSFEKYR
jgi:tRNA A37 threonylcarbamoyladenosine dehydratase